MSEFNLRRYDDGGRLARDYNYDDPFELVRKALEWLKEFEYEDTTEAEKKAIDDFKNKFDRCFR